MDKQEKYSCQAEELRALEELEVELVQSEEASERFDRALERLRKSSKLPSVQKEVLSGLAKRVRKCRERSRKARCGVSRLRREVGA